jgi:peptidoglycan biosynthesis protein MviN/MurJ (putative lipid II flippase)
MTARAAAVATGFNQEKQQLAVNVMRDLLPLLLCFGMSYQFSAWLRADKFFTVATAAPVLVPVVILIFFFVEGSAADLNTLLYGTLVGAFLHMLVLLLVIWRGFRLSLGLIWSCLFRWEAEMRQVMKNSVPFVFAGAIFTSVVMVDQTMAAWLEEAKTREIVIFNRGHKADWATQAFKDVATNFCAGALFKTALQYSCAPILLLIFAELCVYLLFT